MIERERATNCKDPLNEALTWQHNPTLVGSFICPHNPHPHPIYPLPPFIIWHLNYYTGIMCVSVSLICFAVYATDGFLQCRQNSQKKKKNHLSSFTPFDSFNVFRCFKFLFSRHFNIAPWVLVFKVIPFQHAHIHTYIYTAHCTVRVLFGAACLPAFFFFFFNFNSCTSPPVCLHVPTYTLLFLYFLLQLFSLLCY